MPEVGIVYTDLNEASFSARDWLENARIRSYSASIKTIRTSINWSILDYLSDLIYDVHTKSALIEVIEKTLDLLVPCSLNNMFGLSNPRDK